MKEKSKLISGLKWGSEFSIEERRMIIEEWLASGKTKSEIWFKYTRQTNEHGNLNRWMQQLGYVNSKKSISFNVLTAEKMAKTQKHSSNEILQMQEKIKELEKALVNSELRATAYETMIEIAEKELKINIRKKSNTKQSTR
jgi:hypothetical protein